MGNNSVGYVTLTIPGYTYLNYTSASLGCMLLFEASDVLKDFWVLGDPFLRTFLTAFDVEDNKIGFYPMNGASSSYE